MLTRLIKLPKGHSLFLFGARNTGKSTLLKKLYPSEKVLWINLLDATIEETLSLKPAELKAWVLAMPPEQKIVVIDEIQKVPSLLDVVHDLIESTKKIFVLTGSSARKLKQGGANLLAGRALVYHLYPFSFLELKKQFDLHQAMTYGLLAGLYGLKTEALKQRFLQTYAHTYLKEEVWAEHLIRHLPPFRKFLEAAAQSHGKLINYSNIARDVGVDDKTVQNYYSILEDTLIGFHLEAYQHSFRKRLSKTPKFYFIDNGIARALARMLSVPLHPRTSYYGEVFEQFIILECYKLAQYYHPEYRFCYLQDLEGPEIDLVVERPGQKLLLIEIKSTDTVQEDSLKTLKKISVEMGECEAICLCQEKQPKRYGDLLVLPWEVGIKRFLGGEK